MLKQELAQAVGRFYICKMESIDGTFFKVAEGRIESITIEAEALKIKLKHKKRKELFSLNNISEVWQNNYRNNLDEKIQQFTLIYDDDLRTQIILK